MTKFLLNLIIPLVMISTPVLAQTISGTVKSAADGSPVPGVSVLLKGTTAGTVTNDAGKYTLKLSPGGNTLVFSAIGFQKQEVAVSGNTVVDVTLKEDASSLDEVVVTALGMNKEQRALGYSTSTVKAEDLTRTATPNFASALYGKAPGVRIATAPGGATSGVNITIRGVNSITGNNQPLIVLDGIPIRNGDFNNTDYWSDQRIRGNGLLDINPEDVDNISILKGASAAALYGSDAVNGVVLITTKKGKSKKGFAVDASASYSVDNVAYLPRYQNVRGPGIDKRLSDGGQGEDGFVYYDINGDGTKETRGVGQFSINFGPKFDGKPTMAWDGQIRPYEAQKNNMKNAYQTAHNSNINVALSHATESANIRFSLTRQQNEGVSLGAKNTKNIANLNSTFYVNRKLTTDVMVNYINQDTRNRPFSIDRLTNNFTGMLGRFDNPLWYLNKYKTSLGYKYVTATNQSLTPDENIKYNGFRADFADYIWNVKEHQEDERSNRVIASLTNTWQIVDGLSLRGRLSTDFTSMKTESRQTTERPISFGTYTGYYGVSNLQTSILYGDLLLTYRKKLTSDLEMSVMGGYTATKSSAYTITAGTNGGLSTENKFDISASVNQANASTTRVNLTRDALIGTANLSFKNFFFVEGTVRRDRTSTLNPGGNSFVYPSVNSSLVLTDAFNLPSAVSFAKLRGSWGIVGNSPSAFATNIAFTQGSLGTQQTGGNSVLYTYMPSTFGNMNLRPEEKHEIEFGLETKFFNNRLGFDVSYYNGQIRDQILNLTLPSTSGATAIIANVGTLRNKGIEVALNGVPVQARGFMWNTGINFSWNRNIVEKLANGSNELLHADYDGNAAQLKSVVGQPMGDFYIHPVAVDASGRKIVNPDGLYKLDDKMVKAGNAMPKIVGGFFNSFSYKGFSLDVMTDFRWGGVVMPTGLNWMISRGLLTESLNGMDKAHGGLSYYVDANKNGVLLNGTTAPGGQKVYDDGMLLDGVTTTGEKNTNVISQAYYYWNVYNWGGPQYSSARYELYVKENSYIKLRELSIGYTLPASIASKIGAKKLQISAFGRNLFFFYRTIKDMDPEQTTAGSKWAQNLTNVGSNPATRTAGVMLRASF